MFVPVTPKSRIVAGAVTESAGGHGSYEITGLDECDESGEAVVENNETEKSSQAAHEAIGGSRNGQPRDVTPGVGGASGREGVAGIEILGKQPSLTAERIVGIKAKAKEARRAVGLKCGSIMPDLDAGFTPGEWADRLVGTALVLANMSVRKILPSAELSARIAAASRLFGGMTVSTECSLMFPDLIEIFRTELSLQNTRARGWYKRAQIFQIVMLQDLDGSFDPDDDLATAIFARGRVVEDDRSSSNPKVFDADEITRSAPPALLAAAEGGRLNGDDPMRVWATFLAIGVLESEGYDWELTGTFGEIERLGAADSIIRRGHRYLRYTFADLSREDEVGELRAEAAKVIEKFETRQSVAIRMAVGPALKAEKHPSAQQPLHKRVIRFAKVFARSALALHTVARCFTSPVYHPFQRRARVWVLVNYWMGALCVSVWLQAERAVQCCLRASSYMGCGWLPTEADQCTGTAAVHGSCSALFGDPALTHNATAAAAVALKRGEDAFDAEGGYFQCSAFPDPTNVAHKVTMVLLMIVIPVPVKIILRFFFEEANAAFVSPYLKRRSAWESLNLLIDTKVLKEPLPWATGKFMRNSRHLDPGTKELSDYIEQARTVMRHRKETRAKWDAAPRPPPPRARRRLGVSAAGAATQPPTGLGGGGGETFVLYGDVGSVLVPSHSELAQEATGAPGGAPGLTVYKPIPPRPTHYLAALGGAQTLVPSPSPASLEPRVLRTQHAIKRSLTGLPSLARVRLSAPEAADFDAHFLTPQVAGQGVLVPFGDPEMGRVSSLAARKYYGRAPKRTQSAIVMPPGERVGHHGSKMPPLEDASAAPPAPATAAEVAPCGLDNVPGGEGDFAPSGRTTAGGGGEVIASGSGLGRPSGSSSPSSPATATPARGGGDSREQWGHAGPSSQAADLKGDASSRSVSAEGATAEGEGEFAGAVMEGARREGDPTTSMCPAAADEERWLDPVGQCLTWGGRDPVEVLEADGTANAHPAGNGDLESQLPEPLLRWHIPKLFRTWSGSTDLSEIAVEPLGVSMDFEVSDRATAGPFSGVGGWFAPRAPGGGGEGGGVSLGRGPASEARSAETKKRQAERVAKQGVGRAGAAIANRKAKTAQGLKKVMFGGMDAVKSVIRAAKDLQELMSHQLPALSDVRDITAQLHVKQLSHALRQEALQEKRRKVLSRLGWIMSTLSMMIFVYMIYVYGVKMYTNVGKGAELDFIIEYMWFMFLDNMVYSWISVVYKVFGAMSLIYLMKEYMLNHGNPFFWFESYDDGVLNKSLDDGLQQLDQVDDLGLGD
mmetsp:Transcript_37407/g.117805  ORF Transcript_37407/g.117805 Transcript_37407/m.117805 type:complete len:1294 (-) Transcript_37407:307-4188(-)